ncbi:hypothetical protein GH714_024364 [Hevea brasiliensis]|uniref:ABC1 atypical kinase-like domain-containing protein n=1 Tax=Hevea brasiliensis TaxID=3981 RepID=A0A6A6L7R0_HEVBR|nr:hypothetical protein GH714_024364 [Hevea brasiliensis]
MLLLPPPSLHPFPANLSSNFSPINPIQSPFRSFPQPPQAVNRRRNDDVDAFTKKSGYIFELGTSEADSLIDYDIKNCCDFNHGVFVRLMDSCSFFFYFFIFYVFRPQIRAADLRKILLELGPAYVKIAQAVSSRADLIPPSYLDELSLLQDRIAPFSSEIAFNTIEQELGLPVDELFSEISPEPTAAASLGQVYQARLRHNGQLVAIKVQRPGVQAAIALDILILRSIAGVVKRAGKFNSDLQAVVDEWASSLFREMDYVKEANNGLKFRKLYGGIQDVLVPEMYMELTTQKVLVMEWVEVLLVL